MSLPIVLASSSTYRRALLKRLNLPFSWAAPDCDERALVDESAEDLVRRLSCAKACALAKQYPNHLLIGSDQVAVRGGQILGKPHTAERACAQLRAASGQWVTFLTGLCLYNSQTRQLHYECVPFSVTFRELNEAEIERYVAYERPLDCAGSFKAEGLGVSLFASTQGTDSTALIGLPLIALCQMLRREGVMLP